MGTPRWGGEWTCVSGAHWGDGDGVGVSVGCGGTIGAPWRRRHGVLRGDVQGRVCLLCRLAVGISERPRTVWISISNAQ